jgi:multidrug efflux pump subunit AcrB
VRHKFVACGIVGIAFALSGGGMGAVKQQFFPTSDRPEVLVEVRLPEGTSIETTTATVAAMLSRGRHPKSLHKGRRYKGREDD